LVSAIEVVDTIFGADAAQLKTVLTGRLRSANTKASSTA
jgi:hypothetical protein